MRYCSKCMRETEEGFHFCPFCGSELDRPFPSEEGRIGDEEFRSFIGKQADYYLNQFKKFSADGIGRFRFTWNWAAFFFGMVWMLYRKMYGWALVSFLVLLTPVTLPLLMVVWGLTGNYLYYWHSRKKILERRRYQAAGVPVSTLTALGGVNRWIGFIGFFLFLLILMIGILSGLLFFYVIREIFFLAPSIVQT